MKISVIIPVYNCEKYLRDCLESVIHQSYKDLEIILINDGSTDNSGSICDFYAKMDSRIQVIHQENKGVSAARNVGMLQMSGQLVSFIDADDTLDLDMYEFLCSLIDTYHADIAHCGYRRVVGDEIRLVHDSKQIVLQNREEALECLIGARLFVGSLWNKLYRSELLNELTFDEDIKINEDILFNFQVFLRAERIVFADDTKYNYIVHKDESACFVIPDLKKVSDSCKVNRFMYESVQDTTHRTIAAERYAHSLSRYYRICVVQHQKEETKKIKNVLWKLYRANRDMGARVKCTVVMIKYISWIYLLVYQIYDKLRTPNWDV